MEGALSFEMLYTYNPEHLIFNSVDWSDIIDGFSVEVNDRTEKY